MRGSLVLVALAALACRPPPEPNDAGLIVSGKLGIPVFEWSGEEQERLGVFDEGGATLLEIEAAGAPPQCVNGLQSPVRWGQLPVGFVEASYTGYAPAGPKLDAGEGFTAWVSRCVATDTFEMSSVVFDVQADGGIRMDCKASLCP